MIEPRFNSGFKAKMEAYVGELGAMHVGPATLESIAAEQLRQGRKLECIIDHLEDEDLARRFREVQRGPLLSAWQWIKAFSLVAGGGIIQWLFSRGKH